MTHDETKAHIEADIAEERSALAQSISQLTNQFSPENLVSSVGETLKSQSDDLAHAVVRGARENPAALALMGAGVAWLLLSQSKSDKPARYAAAPAPAPAPVGYDERTYEPAPGFRRPGTADDASFKARVAAAEASLQRQEHEEPSWFDQAKDYVARTAAEMRATLYDGTAELSDMARTRVVEARRKALMAQERVEHHARKTRGKGRTYFEENPLLIGGAVAALGAAAAMGLPRTKMEDETFGAHRDALLEEADRVMHEEVSRAKRMAFAAMDEAEQIAREKIEGVPSGDEAVARAEAEVRAVGERIADRAREAKAH